MMQSASTRLAHSCRTTICVHATSEKYLAIARAARLPPDSRLVQLRTLAAEDLPPGRSHCIVVMTDWLGRFGLTDQLRVLNRRLPSDGLVVVTHRTAEVSRFLSDVLVDEVVWFDVVTADLGPAITRACARGRLRKLAQRLKTVRHVPYDLRRALVLACELPRPLRSVGELARTVGCDRRTLARQWRCATGGRGPHLKDFLGWLLLAAARHDRGFGKSWLEVAEGLGVHEHTLRRLALRLVGVSLRVLWQRDMEDLFDTFEEAALGRLLCNG